jgi:hypothetical protein
MYSKEESKKIRLHYWDRFKSWSGSKRFKQGKKAKWLMNDTGMKQLKLKFHFGEKMAQACIEIDTMNLDKRIEIWEKLESIKSILKKHASFPISWELEYELGNKKTVSRIYDQMDNVSIYDTSCWKKVNTFLYSRMSVFEDFFIEYKDYLKYGNLR